MLFPSSDFLLFHHLLPSFSSSPPTHFFFLFHSFSEVSSPILHLSHVSTSLFTSCLFHFTNFLFVSSFSPLQFDPPPPAFIFHIFSSSCDFSFLLSTSPHLARSHLSPALIISSPLSIQTPCQRSTLPPVGHWEGGELLQCGGHCGAVVEGGVHWIRSPLLL